MKTFDNDVLSINDFKDDERLNKWLRKTSSAYSVVLHDSSINLFKSSRHIVNQFNTCVDCGLNFICVCYHDKDLDQEDETRLETPHYQCLIVFNDSMSISSLIKLIKSLFKGVNDNQIGIQKALNIPSMARYTLHRGFYNKYQYPLSELETNNIDLYMKYYNMIDIKDQVDCVEVCKTYHYNLEDIIIHVANYKLYRSIIKDLIQNHRAMLRGY